MAKFYFKSSPKQEKQLTPKKETIDFLLHYSKALKVVEYQKITFESFLN